MTLVVLVKCKPASSIKAPSQVKHGHIRSPQKSCDSDSCGWASFQHSKGHLGHLGVSSTFPAARPTPVSHHTSPQQPLAVAWEGAELWAAPLHQWSGTGSLHPRPPCQAALWDTPACSLAWGCHQLLLGGNTSAFQASLNPSCQPHSPTPPLPFATQGSQKPVGCFSSSPLTASSLGKFSEGLPELPRIPAP